MIRKSDIFVFLDNVKFQKSSWQMRNKLKTTSKDHEQVIWIRIPTKTKTSNELIMNVAIDNDHDWKKKHIKTFEINYGLKIEDISFLQKLYKNEWTCLSDFTIKFITECCKYLDINTELKKSSELLVEGTKSHLVLNICKNLNTTKYLANQGSKQYLEKDKKIFQDAKINLEYHNYQHPRYKQKGTDFIEKLSILDLLFNEFDKSKEIM